MYKSVAMALKNLANHEYDVMQIFTIDDVVTKENFDIFGGNTNGTKRSNK